MDTTAAGIDWDAIENFVGFGRADATVLFLGMEEGLSSGTNLHDELVARSKYAQFEDLRKAIDSAGTSRRFFGPEPVSQRTWRPMCHLMLRRSGVAAIDLTKRSRYQADRLGRIDGDSLLAELLPYPNRNLKEYPYLDRPSRESMVDRRIVLLRAAFKESQFKIVVAYGKAYWPLYRRIFDARHWTTAGVFDIGCYRHTRVMLSPHFSGRDFNSNQQLETFADAALQ